MSIPLRSWLMGIAGALVGCGLYLFDTHVERMGSAGDHLHLIAEVVEFLLVGPGLGFVALLVSEHLRVLRAAADSQQIAERERRFVLLGRLAASVAHEVRNPLHTLRLVVDELRVEQPALRSHALSQPIDHSLERIDRAVDLVYQLARPGTEDDSIGDVVAAYHEAATTLLQRKPDHLLEVAELPARALVRCTPSGLRIMLDNLLRNAAEATAPGTTIRVALRRDDDDWVIALANPGRLTQELPADVPGVAFDTQKSGGLGLGLLITRHLANNAGGSLSLTGVDGQVTAQLRLPAAGAGA